MTTAPKPTMPALEKTKNNTLGSGRIQLQSALRIAERDESNLVSVPMSVGEIRAVRATLTIGPPKPKKKGRGK